MTFLEGTDFGSFFFGDNGKKDKKFTKNYSIFARFMIIYKKNTLKTSTFAKGMKIDHETL